MSYLNTWGFIGCGVHRYTDKGGKLYVKNQGHVVMEKGNFILIEWFSWGLERGPGKPTYATWHELLDFADNETWRFFENVDRMTEYFEEYKKFLESPYD